MLQAALPIDAARAGSHPAFAGDPPEAAPNTASRTLSSLLLDPLAEAGALRRVRRATVRRIAHDNTLRFLFGGRRAGSGARVTAE